MEGQLAIPDPEWLTCEEVARHYRVSARTILRWVAAGQFETAMRLGPGGKTVRIHRSELDRARSAGRSAA